MILSETHPSYNSRNLCSCISLVQVHILKAISYEVNFRMCKNCFQNDVEELIQIYIFFICSLVRSTVKV